MRLVLFDRMCKADPGAYFAAANGLPSDRWTLEVRYPRNRAAAASTRHIRRTGL